MEARIVNLETPVGDEEISRLSVGMRVSITGRIFCGRDAVLPRVAAAAAEQGPRVYGIDLAGGAILHTAVSPAGIGPTTSSKVEIEGSMPLLSRAGVRIHIGKGSLSAETVDVLNEYRAVFVITPPVTAMLTATMTGSRVVAFPEEGMEAFWEISVQNFPGIVAICHGQTIYRREGTEWDK